MVESVIITYIAVNMTAKTDNDKQINLARIIVRFHNLPITYGNGKDIEKRIFEMVKMEFGIETITKMEFKEK